MNSRSLISGLSAAVILSFVGVTTIVQPSYAQRRSSDTFFCNSNYEGNPTTMVRHPKRGELPFIRWVRNFGPNSDWTPARRCKQVSQKLQENLERRTLNYILPGRSSANGLPVLCASSRQYNTTITCPNTQVLMTLRRGDNPQEYLEKIVHINTGAGSSHITHSNPLVQNPDGSIVGIDMALMYREIHK